MKYNNGNEREYRLIIQSELVEFINKLDKYRFTDEDFIEALRETANELERKPLDLMPDLVGLAPLQQKKKRRIE